MSISLLMKSWDEILLNFFLNLFEYTLLIRTVSILFHQSLGRGVAKKKRPLVALFWGFGFFGGRDGPAPGTRKIRKISGVFFCCF